MSVKDYHDMYEYDLFTANEDNPELLIPVQDYEKNPKAYHSLLKLRNTMTKRKRVFNQKRSVKKYYVGAPYLINDYSDYVKSSLEEAIEAAKEKVAETGMAHPVVVMVAVVEPIEIESPVRVRMVK